MDNLQTGNFFFTFHLNFQHFTSQVVPCAHCTKSFVPSTEKSAWYKTRRTMRTWYKTNCTTSDIVRNIYIKFFFCFILFCKSFVSSIHGNASRFNAIPSSLLFMKVFLEVSYIFYSCI